MALSTDKFNKYLSAGNLTYMENNKQTSIKNGVFSQVLKIN